MALSGTKALEAWCKKVTTGYANVNILNMTTSWRSGLAFCAIIHHHFPDLIEFENLDPDDVFGNNSLAFSVAEQHLGIPSLLDPQDMVECELLDKLSILTYLAQYFQAFSQNNVKANLIKTVNIPSCSSGLDLTDTAKLQLKNPLVGRQSDPCKQCGKSVFILERLNVGGRILHRTCFKCARCEDQLTLASFYETETGQFCCEVCPDEENKEERQRTLRVNQDLAKLMAGESENSDDDDDEVTDTDGSVISGNVGSESVEKNSCASLTVNDANSNDGVNAHESVEVSNDLDENLEQKVEALEIQEPPVTKPEVCDNDAFNEDGSEIEKNSRSELHVDIDTNIPTEILSIVEGCDINESVQSEEVPINIEDFDDEGGEEYPEDKNPFGDDEIQEEKSTDITVEESHIPDLSASNNNKSFNPFGSDLDSDEDNSFIVAKKTPIQSSLNPFGSDFSSDEEVSKSSVSPSPSTRSTRLYKKKRPAPPPPTHGTPVPAPRFSLQNKSTSSSPGSSLQRKSKNVSGPPAETVKMMKDVDNLNRRSQILEGIKRPTSPNISTEINTISETTSSIPVSSSSASPTVVVTEVETNKADEGQWRRKKGPAPPRPIPPKRTVKKLARKAINQELFDIEVKQGGLERQGVKLEKSIREICAANDAEEGADRDSLGPEAEDLIIQLFDLVNEKNELFRRQTELIYMKKENRLEEMHADCEYQIRVLMSKPECQRTDDDKMSEERLIAKLVEIVTQRNEIVDCLEMDRLREMDEDTAIEDHMSNYAAVKPIELPKKGFNKILRRKKKKKDKENEKDIDTSEVKEGHSSVEKPKKKSAKKKLLSLASKKLNFPVKK